MNNGLPADIDPIRLADEGTRLLGTMSESVFPRLRKESAGSLGQVEVDLAFDIDIDGRPKVTGVIEADCELVCQRCLQPLRVHLKTDTCAILLTADEADTDSGQKTESIIISGRLSLAGLVEDELLLAMPMIPTHEKSECSAEGVSTVDQKLQREVVDAGKPNPFAVLSRLKDKGNK